MDDFLEQYYERVSQLEKSEKEKFFCEKCGHSGHIRISGMKVRRCDCLIKLQISQYLKDLVSVKGKDYRILEKYDNRNSLFIQSSKKVFNHAFKGYLLNKIKQSGSLEPEEFLSFTRIDPAHLISLQFEEEVAGLENIEYLDSFQNAPDLLVMEFDPAKKRVNKLTAELVSRVLTLREEVKNRTWLVSELNLDGVVNRVIDFPKDAQRDQKTGYREFIPSAVAKDNFKSTVIRLTGNPVMLENEIEALKPKSKK